MNIEKRELELIPNEEFVERYSTLLRDTMLEVQESPARYCDAELSRVHQMADITLGFLFAVSAQSSGDNQLAKQNNASLKNHLIERIEHWEINSLVMVNEGDRQGSYDA